MFARHRRTRDGRGDAVHTGVRSSVGIYKIENFSPCAIPPATPNPHNPIGLRCAAAAQSAMFARLSAHVEHSAVRVQTSAATVLQRATPVHDHAQTRVMTDVSRGRAAVHAAAALRSIATRARARMCRARTACDATRAKNRPGGRGGGRSSHRAENPRERTFSTRRTPPVLGLGPPNAHIPHRSPATGGACVQS